DFGWMTVTVSMDLTEDMFAEREPYRIVCEQLIANQTNQTLDAGRIYCDMQWDGLSCWPATPGGQYSIIDCPIMDRIDITKNASKFCQANGSWERLANYNNCIAALSNHPEDDWTSKELDSDYAKRIIYNLGFISSTLTLGIALFIFLYFRSLRCLRNKIHCQLIITFILRNLLWILMQHTLIPIVSTDHKWACKLETSIFNYVQMTNFFWMLVEGMYLHIIIVWTYSADKIKLWYFMVIGWGIPAIIIVIWVSLRIHFQHNLDDKSHLLACWMSTNGSAAYVDQLDWIYNGPILFVLATNMLFLATIIWVLVTKLRASHSLETRQLRKAVKATLLLFPLLGIIYVLFIWPISDAPAVIEAHEFINAVLQSFQGFFVALFYCFLNGEVKAVLKKKFSVYQDSRSLSARYTKSTIGWANDTSIGPKEGIVLTNGHLSPKNNGARQGSPWNTPTIEHQPEETENML
ncbi:corticotropin-releasing factor receptor 1-like, partial [Mizuhopecten yessoensis]|uniref:corticotropin-releasing factor receptor 1-like n=1 Tax=Mizuhopecten yessoensis TaxID=6573 RepID=UPI000B45EB0E